jgi:hypothetical protein
MKLIGCANIKDAPQLAFNGDTFRANTLRGCPITASGTQWKFKCEPENYSYCGRELAVLFNEAHKIGFVSYVVISREQAMVWMDIFGNWHELLPKSALRRLPGSPIPNFRRSIAQELMH